MWGRSLTRSHKKTSTGPSRSCWNGSTSALQPNEITSKGTCVSCVPIRIKSVNLSYASRIYIYIYIHIYIYIYIYINWFSYYYWWVAVVSWLNYLILTVDLLIFFYCIKWSVSLIGFWIHPPWFTSTLQHPILSYATCLYDSITPSFLPETDIQWWVKANWLNVYGGHMFDGGGFWPFQFDRVAVVFLLRRRISSVRHLYGFDHAMFPSKRFDKIQSKKSYPQ